MAPTPATPPQPVETSVIDTLQSLIVAFVLAMTFRGFVLEGFIIPTGSMAPTLMGQHLLWDSTQTGATFPIDARPVVELASRRDPQNRILEDVEFDIADPMLGPESVIDQQRVTQLLPKVRMGDRILVLKCLYPFAMPDRFDVVVFKNPTDPVGDTQNYIKRLVGLPNERLWFVDGDVFASPAGAPDLQGFTVQRKPDHVQRAVWQTVSNSDSIAAHPERLRTPVNSPWFGQSWEQQDRVYRCESAAPTMLQWNPHVRQIDDWTAYDMLLYQVRQRTSDDPVAVSDVRVSAGIVPDLDGLETTFELSAREHLFQFSLADGEATVRLRPSDSEQADWTSASAPIDPFAAGEVMNVEFWHVDQRLAIYINGGLAVELRYDWSPQQRLEHATSLAFEDALDAIERLSVIANRCDLAWRFSGSPVTLHHLRVDRDIHYRIDALRRHDQRNEPAHHGPACGTHPDHLAILGSDYFMMCGDNATASLDSRLWGSAHRLVRHQIIDDAGEPHQPFLVNRKLLIGKAFAVYFPAPYPLTEGGWGVVPDFGRLRFIR